MKFENFVYSSIFVPAGISILYGCITFGLFLFGIEYPFIVESLVLGMLWIVSAVIIWFLISFITPKKWWEFLN